MLQQVMTAPGVIEFNEVDVAMLLVRNRFWLRL